MQCISFKTMHCNGIKNISSENTIFCLCNQSDRLSEVLGTIICWSKSISVTYKEVQSFFNHLNFWRKTLKYPPVYYVVIWVDYYAHSISLYTICISEGKTIFVTYIPKKYSSNLKLKSDFHLPKKFVLFASLRAF